MRRQRLDSTNGSSPDLARLYTGTLAGYLLIMFLLWRLGLEGIYAHPTPFYALFAPSVGLTLAVSLTALYLLAGTLSIKFSQPGAYRQAARLFALGTAIVAIAGLALLVGEAQREHQTYTAYVLERLPGLAWQLPALVVFLAGMLGLYQFVLPRLAPEARPTVKEIRYLLLGIFGFSVAFACAIAMMRGGFHGIEQAYERATYEYIGDIGKTRNIRQLFTKYLEIHEFLSMHAKVHPPGPIALLWFLSYFVGQSAFALSIATVLFSATAVFPLYGWAKRVTDQRAALMACLCYSVVPSVVLFTATSADALFTPFTLSTLYCFERAIRTRSVPFALAAGAGYGIMALLKFSLIGIGAYFALMGLWMLRDRATRWNVVQTAVLMVAGAAAVIGGIYSWSEYNLYESFLIAKAQFDTDQAHLDELSPRLPAWTYRILNPAAWFYFAGIPLSLLFLRELVAASGPARARWIMFMLTLVVLNFLYIARGEGERSALYLVPFVLVPAMACLERMTARGHHLWPLTVTLAFLAFQCWFTETFFYTYW